MKRSWRVIFTTVLCIAAGSLIIYFFVMRMGSGFSRRWFDVSPEGVKFSSEPPKGGYGSAPPGEGDIPLPQVTKLVGSTKFLERYGPQEDVALGYRMNVSVARLDPTKIPEKYRKSRRIGDEELPAIQEAVYRVHFDFALQDADGFALMHAFSPPVFLKSGQDNVFQDVVWQLIPVAIAKRTKSVAEVLIVEDCESCDPDENLYGPLPPRN